MAGEPGKEEFFEQWKTNKLVSLRYHKAICMLAAGIPSKEVAKQIGVSERALQRWFKDDAQFNQSLKYAIGVCFKSALANAAQYSNRAVEVLIEIIEDVSQPVRYRLQAIQILFQFQHSAGSNKVQENPQLLQSQEQIELLNSFRQIQQTLFSIKSGEIQKQDMIPAYTDLTNIRELWATLYPDQPYPEPEDVQKWIEGSDSEN